MRFGYHNHWWEFDVEGGRFKYDLLMEQAPDIFGELDIYWAANFGAVKVPEVVKKYRSRMPLLHVKDGPLVKDQPHVAVGAGKMDVNGCIRRGRSEGAPMAGGGAGQLRDGHDDGGSRKLRLADEARAGKGNALGIAGSARISGTEGTKTPSGGEWRVPIMGLATRPFYVVGLINGGQ